MAQQNNTSLTIGLTGNKQAGKDTIAKHLIEHYGFAQYGLGDGVKSALYALNPYLKSMKCDLQEYVDLVGWDKAKQNKEVRALLQRMGTEAGRDIHGEDLWVNRTQRLIASDRSKLCVISDVRFTNETEICDILWLVENPRTQDPADTHASEQGVSRTPDAIFLNDGTIEELYSKIDEEMKHLKIRKV